MAANFFIRTIKKNGEATLFVRVRIVGKGIDIKQSLGFTVDAEKWTKAQKDVRALKRYREIESEKCAKMDAISSMVKALIEENEEITADMLRKRIYEIVNAERLLQKRNVKRKKLKPKQKRNGLLLMILLYSILRNVQPVHARRKTVP